MDGMTSGADTCYALELSVGYMLWNRLIDGGNPERLNRALS